MNSVGVVLLLLGCLALGVRGQQPCPDQTDPAVIVVATIFATLAVVFIVAGVIFFLIWRRRKGEVSFNFRGAPDPWSCVGVLFHHCTMLSSGRDDCLCCKLFIFYLYLDRCKSSCLNFDTYSHLSNNEVWIIEIHKGHNIWRSHSSGGNQTARGPILPSPRVRRSLNDE